MVVGKADTLLPSLLSHNDINRSVLSHLVRKAQRPGKPLQIGEADLPSYQTASPPPNPQEQLDNLILWIGHEQHSPGTPATSSIEPLAATVGASISPPTSNEGAFQWLLGETASQKLFTHGDAPGGRIAFQLTMNGWNRYEELRHQRVASRTAFMAMKFGDRQLQKVLEDCFNPAVARAGFERRPLNEKQPAGLIDNQIRAAIRSARFVVADLTHDNNGAYFEAGFAEGLGLPVLYTCEAKKFEAKKTHFDTNHMHTIPWDAKRLGKAADKLTATIRVTLPAEADLGPP